MNKNFISVIIGIVFLAIIVIIVIDYLGKRPGRLGKNPYEYNVDEYRIVDSKLIQWKETRNFPLNNFKPGGISVNDGRIWIVGDGEVQSVTMEGIREVRFPIEGEGTCLFVEGDDLFIGFEDHIARYITSGEHIANWDIPGKNCVFTSIAKKGETLYVADAGNRRVLIYDLDGNLTGEFEGKSESEAGHGFIVPSANFDLIVNSYGELWVVNPGKHALENYTDKGELRGFWENISTDIEGFTGCCNPAEIAVLVNGNFITSEKGMVRIKEYDPSGKLISVIAPPDKFKEEGKAPEVAVDDNNIVYALDFDRNVIRVFERR